MKASLPQRLQGFVAAFVLASSAYTAPVAGQAAIPSPATAEQPAAATPAVPATPAAPAIPATTEDANAAYQRAAELGFKEFELGNYAEAEARFLEAHAIDDNARVLRALGMVEYELRDYARCIEFLERALRSDRRPLAVDERSEAEELLARSRGYVARYTILTRPSDAQLFLDSAPLALNADRSALLRVGPHNLEARAASYLPAQRELHVLAREDRTLDIQLQPSTRAADTHESTPLYKSPWLWLGVGAAAIGGGVLLAFLLKPEKRSEVEMPVTTAQSPGVIIRALGGR